jgi:hypothetical protein
MAEKKTQKTYRVGEYEFTSWERLREYVLQVRGVELPEKERPLTPQEEHKLAAGIRDIPLEPHLDSDGDHAKRIARANPMIAARNDAARRQAGSLLRLPDTGVPKSTP